MARMIDVDIKQERIKIDFPYERELVDVVRTLPDRWFDRRSKCWFVPLQHLNYVIRRLEGYHFKFSPRLRHFRTHHQDETVAEPALPEVPEGSWTISRLNQAARAALRERFDESIWVVGELQDFEKNRASNYRTFFFDLVERPFAGANEVARLKAVLFERHRKTIAKRLQQANIELADGMAVRVSGRIDLYARNGRYQILVEDIDPTYTAGEIELNRERIYQSLKRQGLESKNLDKPWPSCPLRVGLITSYESDAYNDFIHQLRQSGRGFSIAVHDANVQGVHTERSVLRALAYFEQRADEFDVIAIVRGGGSRSELAYFDTEAIGKAVCHHPLKVISGVGHQRDTCLLDLIAEPTKTPTAAANRIAEQVENFVSSMHRAYGAIAHRAERVVHRRRQDLVRAGARLERQVGRRLGLERRRQTRQGARVNEVIRGAMSKHHRGLEILAERLQMSGRRKIERNRHQIQRARHQLSKKRLLRRLQRYREIVDHRVQVLSKSTRRDTENARQRLDHLQEQLALIDPRRILERGFVLARDEAGLIRSQADVAVGDDFDVIFGDGVLRARRLEDEGQQQRSPSVESTPEPVE